MDDRATAIQYLPAFWMDENEPFPVTGIGYTVYEKSRGSVSFNRQIELGSAAFMVEYAIFFDYDIQHLYDLEHVFVYVNADGSVKDVEASFHGWVFKSLINGLPIMEGTRPRLYCQPGKHALLPAKEYFNLYPDLFAACREKAGVGGFLIPPFLQSCFKTDEKTDRAAEAHIRGHYSFTPSMNFIPFDPDERLLMPFSDLLNCMEARLKKELAVIFNQA